MVDSAKMTSAARKGYAPAPVDSNNSKSKKAALRGVSHNFAAVAAASAGAMLTVAAPTGAARLCCAIYALTLTTMFSISALYHRPAWGPSKRALMRRLDHSAIYLVIAGTYTPLCAMALDQQTGMRVVSMVWIGAIAGIIQTVFARGAAGSKVISAVLYVALGWIVLPYAGQLKQSLDPVSINLIVAGGIIYSLGAVVYATRRPDPFPATFGYHEVFHALVIAAALLHFIAVTIVVYGAHERSCKI